MGVCFVCIVRSAWRLQVEVFEEVERAFEHVDYLQPEQPEHKVDCSVFHLRYDHVSLRTLAV